MVEKVQVIYKQTVQSLCAVYDEKEAASIASLLFSDVLLIDKMTRLTNSNLVLGDDQMKLYHETMKRLLKMEPFQHITKTAYFYGEPYFVTNQTLIPRPETEELIDLIVRENSKSSNLNILDVGTGSGCIPIALALNLKPSIVTSIDISEEALLVAKKNAYDLKARVNFLRIDTLNEVWPFADLDIVVSNPPYIPQREKTDMGKNVVEYEPELALFVPNNDPLLFYRAISEKAVEHLKSGGKIYFEIHHAFGQEMVVLLKKVGFIEVRVLLDLQGKDRFVVGQKQAK